jgi:hypothetical protein
MNVKSNVRPPSLEGEHPRRHWRRRIHTAAVLCRLVPLFWLLGILKHVLPIRLLARWAWARQRVPRQSSDRSLIVGRVLRAGAIAGAPDRDCLQRSLLLYRELSRHGFSPTLVVGIRPSSIAAGGHAWVRTGGDVVGEPASDIAQFEPLLRFGVNGALESQPTPAVTEFGRNA